MNTTHPFDQATAVTFGPEGARGHTDDRYKAFVGPFGGVTAATILRAVLEHPERLGDPLAITVNYCAPVADGPFDLQLDPVRTNRSSQHWIVQLRQSDGVAATATVMTGVRRDAWTHQPATAPEMPPPDRVEVYGGSRSIPWVRQFRFRFAQGHPLKARRPDGEPGPSLSHLWIEDDEPRPVDLLSLVNMSDAFFARIFLVLGAMLPFGTMSLTTYLHVSAEELLQDPVTAVFGAARANVFHKGFADQTGELWLPSGRLAATTQQITYFKT